jgi:hypothetical protein
MTSEYESKRANFLVDIGTKFPRFHEQDLGPVSQTSTKLTAVEDFGN